jgi:hypothetical protein
VIAKVVAPGSKKLAAFDLPINQRNVRRRIPMKQPMRHLTLGLALFLANFASQGMAQSSPQQVKGINARGAKWQALTDQGQVAVTTNATTEYVAWKVNGSENIDYST